MVEPGSSDIKVDKVLESAGVGTDFIKATDGRGTDAAGRLEDRGNARISAVCVGRSYCDRGNRR